jgi:hypothetical protein
VSFPFIKNLYLNNNCIQFLFYRKIEKFYFLD